MSGLSRRDDNQVIFLSLSKGNLVQRVKEPTSTSKSRKLTMGDNMGKEVHEELFQRLQATLIKAEVAPAKDKYSPQWKFLMKTSGEDPQFFQLAMDYASGNACTFLNLLLNCDVTKELIINTGEYKNEKKETKYYLTIRQGGQTGPKVERRFTKEKPEGMPDWEKIEYKGQPVTDCTKQVRFLEQKLNENVVPKLPKDTASVAATVATAAAASPVTEDDDLPF